MKELIEEQFTYHSPSPEQVSKMKQVREQAKALAYIINYYCPESEDSKVAIQKLREAVMFANASIVLEKNHNE